MEKRLFVQLNGNRKVIGILRGYDVIYIPMALPGLFFWPVHSSIASDFLTGLHEHCPRRRGGREIRWRKRSAGNGGMSAGDRLGKQKRFILESLHADWIFFPFKT